MMDKKIAEEAKDCSECVELKDDKGTLRCMKFYGAIIEDTTEKHCKDSIH